MNSWFIDIPNLTPILTIFAFIYRQKHYWTTEISKLRTSLFLRLHQVTRSDKRMSFYTSFRANNSKSRHQRSIESKCKCDKTSAHLTRVVALSNNGLKYRATKLKNKLTNRNYDWNFEFIQCTYIIRMWPYLQKWLLNSLCITIKRRMDEVNS